MTINASINPARSLDSSPEADFDMWEVLQGSPSDRMAIHIAGAQRKQIGDAVLYPKDGGRIVEESPANASPDAYDVALMTLARRQPDGRLTEDALRDMLTEAVPKAAYMLDLDLSTQKLIPPSRFWSLSPDVLAPISDYFEWVPAIYETI